MNQTEITAGSEVTVDLISLTGETFAGFIIQARRVDGDFISGTFEIVEGDYDARYLHCINKPQTSVTHTHNEPKTSVSVQWRAPADFTGEEGEVKIFATVVQSYANYWVNLESEILTVNSTSVK